MAGIHGNCLQLSCLVCYLPLYEPSADPTITPYYVPISRSHIYLWVWIPFILLIKPLVYNCADGNHADGSCKLMAPTISSGIHVLLGTASPTATSGNYAITNCPDIGDYTISNSGIMVSAINVCIYCMCDACIINCIRCGCC